MGGGAYHAVVQRQTQTLLGGQMSVNDVGLIPVSLAQKPEQRMRLRGKIVLVTDKKKKQ